MAELASSQNAAIPASVMESSNQVPPPAPQKQKMILTDGLRELLGQILHANLVSMHMQIWYPWYSLHLVLVEKELLLISRVPS